MVQDLFNEASKDKKSIFVATLDCRDAFGSVSHELLEKPD
jgi:hypothetical protein